MRRRGARSGGDPGGDQQHQGDDQVDEEQQPDDLAQQLRGGRSEQQRQDHRDQQFQNFEANKDTWLPNDSKESLTTAGSSVFCSPDIGSYSHVQTAGRRSPKCADRTSIGPDGQRRPGRRTPIADRPPVQPDPTRRLCLALQGRVPIDPPDLISGKGELCGDGHWGLSRVRKRAFARRVDGSCADSGPCSSSRIAETLKPCLVTRARIPQDLVCQFIRPPVGIGVWIAEFSRESQCPGLITGCAIGHVAGREVPGRQSAPRVSRK